jgi:hypothetical protein
LRGSDWKHAGASCSGGATVFAQQCRTGSSAANTDDESAASPKHDLFLGKETSIRCQINAFKAARTQTGYRTLILSNDI